MAKKYFLRLVSTFGLLCLISNDSYNSTTLAANNIQSLSIIAEFNRANREILNSMDCEYTRSLNTYSDIQKEVSRRNPDIKVMSYPKLEFKGRFAFDGDKVLTSENTEGRDEYYQYVKNGKQIRNAQSQNPYPRTINYGTVGIANIKPPIPDPWAHTGYPLIYRLDKLDKRNEKVISVDSKFERGKELKVVTIEQRPDVPIVITVTIDFSVQDGYLPVRVRQEIKSKSSEELEYISEQSVEKILKYNVGGNTLYLPASFHRKVYKLGELSYTSDFNIQEETVRINPELPDDLFRIEILPNDQVINADLKMEMSNPFHTDFMPNDRIPQTKDISHKDLIELHLSDDIKLELIYISPGEFMMGSPPDEIGYPAAKTNSLRSKGLPLRDEAEGPQHRVVITNGFYIGKFEVTNEQYRCLKPDFAGRVGKLLVEMTGQVIEELSTDDSQTPFIGSWNEAIDFCHLLSASTGRPVRLPTEIEWEYACRGGTKSRFFWGNSEKEAGEYANVADESFKEKMSESRDSFDTNDGNAFIASVGQYSPNKFELYDMIGNVSEWCQDVFVDNAYSLNEKVSNTNREHGLIERVFRGGSFRDDISQTRSASRRHGKPDDTRLFVGFRVVVDVE